MSERSFCFLHAGDFRLHEGMAGVGYVPAVLQEILVDAPYRAVTRVFDVAIAEKVAFVVLTGDLLHPLETAPRGLALLTEQFHRLAENQIPVYWVGGLADAPEQWPEAIPLPENVTYFPRSQWHAITHQQDGQPMALILGRSAVRRVRNILADFPTCATHLFTLAALNGDINLESLSAANVHYWALGGRSGRRTLVEEPKRIVHYCGTPQARSPEQTEPHGCTLVHVGPDGRLHAEQVPTDVVRFRVERVFVHDRASPQELVRVIGERARQIVKHDEARVQVVTWHVETGPATAAWLLRGEHHGEVLEALQETSPEGRLWPLTVVPLVDGELPQPWYEEQSLLGDYLRVVQMASADQIRISWQECVPAQQAIYTPSDWPELSAAERQALLREAVLLGAIALRGG